MHPFLSVFNAHPFAKPIWLDSAILRVSMVMKTEGGHDWGHLSRVLNQAFHIALSIGKYEKLNIEILIGAVLFHDIINLPKNSPDRKKASVLSANQAVIFFKKIFTDRQLRNLRNAIEAHSFSAAIPTECVEAEIVQDADRLESVGALAIARTFYVSGLMGSDLFHPKDPFGDIRENRNDREYAVDHFYQKVFLLPNLMNTEYAKTLAGRRNESVKLFLEALRLELNL